MNSMNDQQFFDLAMKVIARHADETERAELETLLASQPELKAEFDQLLTEVRMAKEVMPLMAATASATDEFPAYGRERLQTKVRRSFGSQTAAPE